MISAAAILAAALAVAPSDRMAMADRLFNRGMYAEALEEYRALRGSDAVDAASLSYRLAAGAKAAGDKAAARKEAAGFLAKFPSHKLADSVRLVMATCGTDVEARAELPLLDRDGVEPSIRAEALVRLASLVDDPSLWEKAAKADPKGRYAAHATLMHARALRAKGDPESRRRAVQELMEIACGQDAAYARDALFTAASYSYSDGRYGECATLLRRYAKKNPGDARERDVRRMLALCELLSGRRAEAAALCTDDADETLLYVRAMASGPEGDPAAAQKYLDSFPEGANRRQMELVVARSLFASAAATNGYAAAASAAARAVALTESKNAADRLRLAWAYEKCGDTNRADSAYAAVARDFPKSASSADALYRRAMSQVRAGKWSAAEMSLAEALAGGLLATDRVPLAWYWRGVSAFRSGHGAEGANFLRKALEGTLPLDENREARLMLADADLEAGRTEEAAAAYRPLVREGAVERMGAAKTLAVGRLVGGDEAIACAKALAADPSPEWRQAGWALAGDVSEAQGNFAAAADAYAKCLAEPCETEAAAAASVKLGGYLLRDGRPREAEEAYKRAVALNARDAAARAAAYLGLARAALARDDADAAKGYATVVATLFENTPSAAAAKEMLK